MCDLLQFIDSSDIREYNKDTQFNPAEWAVLVSKSMKKTVEEKIGALQYLADHYTAEEFQEETISCYGCCGKGDLPTFRDVVIGTIEAWKGALDARFEAEGVVFEAGLFEQEYSNNRDYHYFSSYEKAMDYLNREKQGYLEDEYLRDVKTFALMNRIKLDHEKGDDGEQYVFDHEMHLVNVFVDCERAYADQEEFDLVSDWLCHIPLPFKCGDIVKVDFPQTEVHYGVFSCDWKRPEKIEHLNMWVSLETYIEKDKDFDYSDGCPYWDDVLGFSFCPDEELPKTEQKLKLIRAVRKGELDFYTLLHKFGRGDLDEMVKWYS